MGWDSWQDIIEYVDKEGVPVNSGDAWGMGTWVQDGIPMPYDLSCGFR